LDGELTLLVRREAVARQYKPCAHFL
jgi:hypothetical protein